MIHQSGFRVQSRRDMCQLLASFSKTERNYWLRHTLFFMVSISICLKEKMPPLSTRSTYNTSPRLKFGYNVVHIIYGFVPPTHDVGTGHDRFCLHVIVRTPHIQ